MNTDPDATIPSKLEYDKEFSIAVAQSRMSAKWINKSMSVSEFAGKLGTTARTQETFDEYLTMSKGDQDTIKDVGGYVGAMLKGGRRTKASVANRQILTFDIDYGKPETVERVKTVLAAYCYTISSTRKYTLPKPRFRLIVYPDRVMMADEYQAVARKVAEKIDIEVFDSGSFDTNRLMFWPSTSSDGAFLYYHNDATFLPVDKVLNGYGEKDAWKDTSLWPQSSRETKTLDRKLKKQADPLTKKGVIGSFCRVVGIERALDEYLVEIYRKEREDRYTYIEGSSSNGLVIYDGKFAYSNHDSDPCCGQLCNAFDLVRIHKFGHLDDETSPNTSTVKLPSYKEMIEWARDVDGVKADLVKAGMEIGVEAFDVFSEGESEREIEEWEGKLQTNESGVIKSTFYNAILILKNDPKINKGMRFNEFSLKPERWNGMSDKDNVEGENWSAEDSYRLREYVGKRYKVDFPERKIDQATEKNSYQNKYHPVRDYLKGLKWDRVRRIETIFIDYFGCTDNAYVREAAQCWFSAAVHRIYEPGYKFDTSLVISGAQGIGKTMFVRELGLVKWYGELSSFDPKIAMEEITGKWIVEISEMGATNKRELEEQKSFLSACHTRVRMAYAKYAVDFKRQSVFIGSTNQREYLKDSTGNRRWWPLDATVEKVDIKKLRGEVDQIWAEAVMLWAQSKSVYLSEEANKIAIGVQEAKREEDEWEGIIEVWLKKDVYSDRYETGCRVSFDIEGDDTGQPAHPRNRVCVVEIWEDCLDQTREPRPMDRRRIGGIMDNIEGWERVAPISFGKRYGKQRGWRNTVPFSQIQGGENH